MITLIEDTPRKITGITSIFVKFDYNQNIVNAIKSLCDVYDYDKKTHIWEVPLKGIHKLIEELSILDDISIISQVEDKNVGNTQLDASKFKTKPFDYQLEGIKYGLEHDKWLLLDTMGLGKSLQAIYLAQELKERGKIEHCFIICGVNSLKTNWKKEILKHSNLDCVILGERVNSKGRTVYDGVEERAKQLQGEIKEFFIITNVETLRDSRVIDAFKKSKNNIDMIIVDEAHKMKSKESIQGKNLLKLDSSYKLAMTGSLVVNNCLDCYLPLSWIGVEKSTLTNFKNYYCTYSDKFPGMVLGFRNLDVLKEELESCSLRRTKDLLELPLKTIVNEFVDMSNEHQNLYEAVVNGVKDEVDKVSINANNLLSLVTRLRQATSCPQLLTSKSVVSSKVERCCDLATDLIENNEKVVIFTSFKETAYDVGRRLADFNPLVVTGDVNDFDTSEAVDKFQNDENYKIIIATFQKLGTGVTLVAARYMIFVDMPWTGALYSQAVDRIHRIGSERPVFVFNLVCTNTIDERVADIVEYKQALSDYIVDDKLDDKNLQKLQKYIEEL